MQDLKKIVIDFEKHSKIKKYHDQHFMVDKEIIELMVEAAHLSKKDFVLEIGSGLGFLTARLCEKAKRVVAIEKDEILVAYLNKKMKSRNLEFVHLEGIDYIRKNRNKFNKIVSNIPYSISEPLVMELIHNDFDICILTVPKNFADVLIQPIDSETATKLSMIGQSFFIVRKIRDLYKSAFYPEPRKDSSVIEMKPIKDYKSRKREFLIRELVLQGKKKLKNALMEAFINYDKKYGKSLFTKRTSKEIVKKMNLEAIKNKTFNELDKSDIKRILDSI
ncbi:MAG: methyltransferase [Candidatus Aenigmarchaeota archaeon]|nr:methyltransferase [Candidatus Aenigmarchaeota archaeon]